MKENREVITMLPAVFTLRARELERRKEKADKDAATQANAAARKAHQEETRQADEE